MSLGIDLGSILAQLWNRHVGVWVIDLMISEKNFYEQWLPKWSMEAYVQVRLFFSSFDPVPQDVFWDPIG